MDGEEEMVGECDGWHGVVVGDGCSVASEVDDGMARKFN